MKKRAQFASMIILLLSSLTGCEYNTGAYGRFYIQNPGAPKLPLTPLERVQWQTCKYGEEGAIIAPLKKKGYVVMGQSNFWTSLQAPIQARVLAAVAGGDLVVTSSQFKNDAVGSHLVVGSYTPGRVITSDVDMRGHGSYYGDTYGSTSLTASSSGSTYVPSSTTYVREHYLYENHTQRAVVLASPERLAEIKAKGKKN